MSSHILKKLPPRTRRYDPIQAVKLAGDSWYYHCGDVSAATWLALADRTDDQREATLMKLMEQGKMERV